MRIGKKYHADNDPLYYDKISKRISELAYQNGKKAEQQRLLKEMQGSVDNKRKILDERLAKLTSDEPSCRKVLDNIKSGLWDLQLAHSKPIDIIMETESIKQREYAGLKLGATKSEVLDILGSSPYTKNVEHRDVYTISFYPPPVPIRNAVIGFALFKNEKLYQIAIRFTPNYEEHTFPPTGAGHEAWMKSLAEHEKKQRDRDKLFPTVHDDIKLRLIDKYGQPNSSNNSMSADMKSGSATTTWRDRNVLITLSFRPQSEGGITIFYTDEKLEAEKENSGL